MMSGHTPEPTATDLPPRPWRSANTVMGAFVIVDANDEPLLEIFPGEGAGDVVRLVVKAPETAAKLEREREINAELVGALAGMLEDYEDQHGEGFCECTPAHETGTCPACESRAALAKHARAETSRDDAGPRPASEAEESGRNV